MEHRQRRDCIYYYSDATIRFCEFDGLSLTNYEPAKHCSIFLPKAEPKDPITLAQREKQEG